MTVFHLVSRSEYKAIVTPPKLQRVWLDSWFNYEVKAYIFQLYYENWANICMN